MRYDAAGFYGCWNKNGCGYASDTSGKGEYLEIEGNVMNKKVLVISTSLRNNSNSKALESAYEMGKAV